MNTNDGVKSTGNSVGTGFEVFDPVLGLITVELVNDKTTSQLWFIAQKPNTNEMYYYQADDGNNQSFKYIDDKSFYGRTVTGGRFLKYATPEQEDALRRAAVGNAIADGIGLSLWYTTLFLATGGIGNSGVFGTSLVGKFGAGVVEDLTSQLLTNGMDLNKINITSLPTNIIPAFKSNIFTSAGKNLMANTFEFSGEGYKGIGSDNFSMSTNLKSTAIGTVADVGSDKLRALNTGLNWQKYTRARNLSYKPKFAAQYNSMNSTQQRNILLRNISSSTGAGVSTGVVANAIQTEVKN